jgi:hypothetical protein
MHSRSSSTCAITRQRHPFAQGQQVSNVHTYVIIMYILIFILLLLLVVIMLLGFLSGGVVGGPDIQHTIEHGATIRCVPETKTVCLLLPRDMSLPCYGTDKTRNTQRMIKPLGVLKVASFDYVRQAVHYCRMDRVTRGISFTHVNA